MTVAGWTLLLSFIGAFLLLVTSPSDSAQLGAGHGAMAAVAWLTIVWVIGAAGVAAFRRQDTAIGFRFIFLTTNTVIAFTLVAEFLFR